VSIHDTTPHRKSDGRSSMLKPSVQIHNMDGILVAEFWDCLRLDPAPVQDLRKQVEAHLHAKGRPELVVDLSGVSFAGSAALGNFVALQRSLRQHGGRIVFCNVDPTVTEVFRASRLESLFGFEADREAALRSIHEHPGPDSAEKDAPRPERPASAPQGGLASRLRRRSSGPETG
jgi:anti-anti-sigma factor